ncbi:hypothetical protein [Lacihabitans sp. LS3-19]|uniref:hypothetical protein n=1 Tax=Lacihabitans sp. LS3-19 TaxID=2487335 RepID=UPI0020CE73FF|nr:hypothetical protein [Lacihabitans sp. LS3-19]
MKGLILAFFVTFFLSHCFGQNTKKVIFKSDKNGHFNQNLDSVLVFKSNGSIYELEKKVLKPSTSFEYNLYNKQLYQFIFHSSCCLPVLKGIDSDTLSDIQIIQLHFGERLINLKELEVKAQRDRFINSGDTTFIFTNPDDTRPNAAASTLFERVTGLSNNLGRISVLGKTVKEVTIEGRKIYGGVPSLSLEAIKADMIEQMEFVEKKLASGQSINTLNIKLKKESKNLGYGTIDAALGFKKNHLANIRYNKISKTGFFNAFATSNTINQRGIDSKTMDYLRLNSFGNAMNTTGSVIGLYDNYDVDIEENYSVFENKLLGINNYSDAGINYTLTRQKLELNTFMFLNDVTGKIFQNTNSESLLGEINQKTKKKQRQINNESALNSSLNLIFKPNSKVTFRFSNFINVTKVGRLWSDTTENITNFNLLTSYIYGNLGNKNHLLANSSNVSLIINGKKPGTLTSFFFNQNLNKNNNENKFENIIIFDDIIFQQISNQRLVPFLNTENIQFIHAKPITKRILLEAKFKMTNIKNSNKLIDNFEQKNNELINSKVKNQLVETGIYALYQRPKLKAITGLNYIYWDIKRERNIESFNQNQNFLINPFTKLETKLNRNPLWLRISQEVTLPGWSQVGSLPDSSNLNIVSSGNIYLNNYVQRNIQLGSSFRLKGDLQSSITLGFSKFLNPIINDNQLNPLFNVVFTSFVNSPNPNISLNANLSIFRIKMNSKFSLFYYSNFIHLISTQKVNESFSQLKTNILLNTITASYKVNKNVIFKINWAARFNWLNGGLIFNNDFIISNNLDLGKKWYLDSKMNLTFNKNKNLISQQFLDLEIGKYMLKKNNFKGNIFVKNAFNYQNQISVYQTSNFQLFQSINQLPRVVGIQVTIYPETFRKN